MGNITFTPNVTTMATHHLSLSLDSTRERSWLHDIAEVLKYFFSFNPIDADNDRYQACLQTLLTGLSRLPTVQEVNEFKLNLNASLRLEFSEPDATGTFQTITATLTHNPAVARQDILTVDASNAPSVTVTLPAIEEHISQQLQTLIETYLRNSRSEMSCNLQGVDLRGATLPENLQGVRLSGALLDGPAVAEIALAIRAGRADKTALVRANLQGVDLRGARLPTNLQGVRLSGALLDGPAVAEIALAIRAGRADKTALVRANLQGANLQGVDLRGVDLRGVDLRGAVLQGLDLRGVDLRGARLSTNLQGVRLSGALLDGPAVGQIAQAIREGRADPTTLVRANLRGVDLRGVDLQGANLQGANLRGANLQGVDLRGVDLQQVDLQGARLPTNLQGVGLSDALLDGPAVAEIAQDIRAGRADKTALVRANLQGANLQGANLLGANLQGVDLWGVDLRGANLRGANLRGGHLNWANLQGVDLRGGDLRGVALGGADLWGGDLQGADLRGGDLRGVALLGVDLRGATLPENLQGVRLSGALLDGPAVGQIAQAIREGRADPTALAGTNLGGVNLQGVDLGGIDLRDAHFVGALLDGPAVGQIAQAIREGRADPTALTGINLTDVPSVPAA
ncbi:TPA: pentapeptide repeat-containing protein [Yersinia enterocolitica]